LKIELQGGNAGTADGFNQLFFGDAAMTRKTAVLP